MRSPGSGPVVSFPGIRSQIRLQPPARFAYGEEVKALQEIFCFNSSRLDHSPFVLLLSVDSGYPPSGTQHLVATILSLSNSWSLRPSATLISWPIRLLG